MPGRVEKSVFISYRRTNLPWALNIYQYLTYHKYDVFFDYESINSGDFAQIIIGNIKARAHFIVVLTPSALERCINPDDWLRREIETALDEKRNIVPLFLENFSFSDPVISHSLTGRLEILKSYNGLNVPVDYFEEAMHRLCTRFLDIPLSSVLHPPSTTVQRVTQKQKDSANQAQQVGQNELKAQDWFEQGKGKYHSKLYEESIQDFTESIRLKPDFADAYFCRGHSYGDVGKPEEALRDYTEAISLKPDYAEAYNNRGNLLADRGDLDNAIEDFTRSIEFKNPDLYLPYNNRGNALIKKSDLEGALQDFNEAIKLNPNFVEAINGRGIVYQQKGDLEKTIRDFTRMIELKPPELYLGYNNRGNAWRLQGNLEQALDDLNQAIRLNPEYAGSFYNRALIWQDHGKLDAAIADFRNYLKLGGGLQNGNQKETEELIEVLKSKLVKKNP